MKKLIFPTLLTFLALPLLFQVAPIQILKLKTFDYLVPKQEPTGFFTILNISERKARLEAKNAHIQKINQRVHYAGLAVVCAIVAVGLYACATIIFAIAR
jgi:hypothetical protein